jgi:phage terminase small subunit
LPKVSGLSEKERRFVEAYMGAAAGNAAEAVRLAGYKNKTAQAAATQGSALLRKPHIAAAVLKLQESDPLVATRKERQEFWTKAFRGELPDFDSKDRLRASELLGKASGDFLERIANPDGSPLGPAVFVVPPTIDDMGEWQRRYKKGN